ncbi:MAG TPA: hypothetical protein VMT52_05465 [Planctomycetota bacterium]|nr:hypothetical protein [Planctomycetota bacterium]
MASEIPEGSKGDGALSYSHGASAVPLLGETIGENLRRTADRFGARDALVVEHQGYRATYRELWVLEVRRCLSDDRHGKGAEVPHARDRP